MYLPLLVSTVLLGIPHGALDHLIPSRLGWRWGQRPGAVMLYVAAYALLAALALSLWWLFPRVAFWGFVLLSCLHWGHGDLHYLETVQGRRRSGAWSAALTLLARGSLPILVPLLAFPDWFGRLAFGAEQAFGRSPATPAVSDLLSPALMGGLAALVGIIGLAYVADTLNSSRAPLTELAEAAREEPVSLVQLIYRANKWESGARDYEFSARTMAEHWDSGKAAVAATIDKSELVARNILDGKTAAFDLTPR